MIEQIAENPKEVQKALAEKVSKAEWRHGFRIANEAIDDIWYDTYLYTEVHDGELIAIGTAKVDGRGFLDILNLATKYWRRGSGAWAVQEFKALAEGLDTDITLMSAVESVGFWQRVGFEVDDCYYGDEPDGVLMWQEE